MNTEEFKEKIRSCKNIESIAEIVSELDESHKSFKIKLYGMLEFERDIRGACITKTKLSTCEYVDMYFKM